jgi:hypothetical protein
MIKKRDLSFKTYIWTQFPDKIVRSKIIKTSKHAKDSIDSDNPSEDEDPDEDDVTLI